MPERIIKNETDDSSIELIYAELGESFGYYRARPGKAPYICLNSRLLEGSEAVRLNVYRYLLDFHHHIPPDSPYRLFPITRHFEEIIPEQAPQTTPAIEKSKIISFMPEVIFIGNAIRVWRVMPESSTSMRLIGRQPWP